MYYILEKQNRSPRQPSSTPKTLAELQVLLPLEQDALWACDIETTGVLAHAGDRIVGIGFANEDRCFYVDIETAAPEMVAHVKAVLLASRLVGFNNLFDGAFLQVWCGQWLDWRIDCYGLFKLFSTEGWDTQRWSLDVAQREVLGWPASNKDVLGEELKKRGLRKGDMWQLGAEHLGPYCAADADSTWQLMEYLLTVCERFPDALEYHQRLFLTEVRLLAEQQLRGIYIDQQRLQSCHRETLNAIDTSMNAFLTNPDVAPHIQAFNTEVHAAWKASEPPPLTKTGKPSARHQAWVERESRWMADNGFNPNSKPQLAWLFYTALGNKVAKTTETGKPVVDRKILPTLGEPGQLLTTYNLHVKRRGYVERLMERTASNGVLNPQFNSFGTLTTRLGGSGGLNVQQMPKTASFLHAWSARPGFKLVQADAEALEPVILAEFSQDPTLLSLYGPGAPANDVYLFLAAKIPALAVEVRAAGYDPDAPTAAVIKNAKKVAKRTRGVAKIVHLASGYGAGPRKIQETLALAGIDLSFAQVKQIHSDYWRLFAGVKRFEMQLLELWHRNEGWIPSILGTPIPVAEKYLRDITNRVIQTSGHMVLQLWLHHVDRLRAESGIEAHPWIADFHDEMVWEVREDQADAFAALLSQALDAANAELDMGIKIKGPPAIGDTLAVFKVEGYADWLAEQE